MKYLKQSNGKFWLTPDGRKVPKKCPVCGADMGLFLRGEPVFLCKSQNAHYFSTLKMFHGQEDE